jgi:hypothetical protein
MENFVDVNQMLLTKSQNLEIRNRQIVVVCIYIFYFIIIKIIFMVRVATHILVQY